MDESKILDLAQRIHKRRIYAHPGSLKAQATAEALIADAYGIELTLDTYDDHMRLNVRDEGGRLVTVFCAETAEPFFRFQGSAWQEMDLDVIIFVVGATFDDVEVLGWLPAERMLMAPKHPVSKTTWELEIRKEFLFDLPEEFNFIEPELEFLPKVWSYDLGGWWTPIGYVYDAVAQAEIERLDVELAG